MKKTLITVGLVMSGSMLSAQNIDDNKVTFSYIQLPQVRIDDKFTTYEVRFNHSYRDANEDSLASVEMRRTAASNLYNQELAAYKKSKDSIDRIYLKAMSQWEIKKNAGAVTAEGNPIPQPSAPNYPYPPIMATVNSPQLHTDLSEEQAGNSINLQGFDKGLGGAVVTLDVMPLSDVVLVKTKTGSGSSIKWTYKYAYKLPVKLTVESPTQGALYSGTMFEQSRYHTIGSYKSQYEFDLYAMDNREAMLTKLETSARNSAMNEINNYLNNQFGYITKNRVAEIYSVKKHKKHIYTDVTNAYTLTVQALGLVKNERDRSAAEDKINEAIGAWNTIMAESNLTDNAARINDKISAMIQCNLAELLVWKGDFDQADMQANLAKNSNVGKAKRHIQDEVGFYAALRARWEANY